MLQLLTWQLLEEATPPRRPRAGGIACHGLRHGCMGVSARRRSKCCSLPAVAAGMTSENQP